MRERTLAREKKDRYGEERKPEKNIEKKRKIEKEEKGRGIITKEIIRERKNSERSREQMKRRRKRLIIEIWKYRRKTKKIKRNIET